MGEGRAENHRVSFLRKHQESRQKSEKEGDSTFGAISPPRNRCYRWGEHFSRMKQIASPLAGMGIYTSPNPLQNIKIRLMGFKKP